MKRGQDDVGAPRWERRLPPPDARVSLQWANRCPRGKDPFFWLSLVPLAAVLVALGYGLVRFDVPRTVGLLLLAIAGVSVIQFLQRWGTHYENCFVTEAGLARVFPQVEVPGVLRLFPLLQALFPRPRFLAWTRVKEVRRTARRLAFTLADGRELAMELRPLRLIRGSAVMDVEVARGAGRVVPLAAALDVIEREVRRAHRRAANKGERSEGA